MSMRQSRSPLQRRAWRPLGNARQAKENTREAGRSAADRSSVAACCRSDP
jgi:hypothetical protein